MQGTRLARIVVNARDRLRVREIVQLLTPHVAVEAGGQIAPHQVDQFSSALLGAHAELLMMLKDPESSQVLQQLGLPRFFEDATIGKMLAAFHSARDSNGIRADPRLWLFRNFLENIEAFDNLANALQVFLIDQRFRRSSDEEGLVELAFMSREGDAMTLDHLSAVLATLRSLHDLIARAVGEPGSTARIAVIDSGSDFLMALLAKAKTASAMGNLLTQWWDWVKYRELHDFDRKMDSMFKGLGVISELDKMAVTTGPEAEQAKVLRQSIFDKLKTLTGLGIKVSEPDRATADRPLLEAKRDVKLLKQPDLPE
jgi:hypothetical protein